MGKILNTGNPLKKVGLLLQDKRTTGHIILEDRDVKIYVDGKETFSTVEVKTLSENTATTVDRLSNESLHLLSTRRLDNLKQVFYRNLEGDNFLPLEDFEGRTRPIGTPIEIVNINQNEYILRNMPFIKDLAENPGNWTVWDVYSDWTNYVQKTVRLISAEYIGNYDIHTNCIKITTVSEIPEAVGGHYVAFVSFMSYGLNYRKTPVLNPDLIANSWKKSQTGMQFMYKHSDGRYIGLANGDNSTLSGADRRINKLIWSVDPMEGVWAGLFSDIDSNIDDIREMNILPEGFVNYLILGVEKIDAQDGMYVGAVSLWNSSNQSTGFGIIMFNEDWTYRRIIQPTIDYAYEIGLNQLGYGYRYTKYKGKHLITVQDGSWGTGKRIVLSSNNIEGPYVLHSTVYDFTNDTWLKESGSMFSTGIANLSLLSYNSELYMITSGRPGNTIAPHDKIGGLSTKHCLYLWKYDDAKNTWNVCVSPIATSMYATDGHYDFSTLWARSHTAVCHFQFIEGGKMWITGSLAGAGAASVNNSSHYSAAILQIDLVKALQ